MSGKRSQVHPGVSEQAARLVIETGHPVPHVAAEIGVGKQVWGAGCASNAKRPQLAILAAASQLNPFPVCKYDSYDPRMVRPESWIRLAGGSPVPVSTGAPGSRPRFVAERRRAKRGVKSLFGGSKCTGRSSIANSAASSDSQQESRAAHVTVKATSGESRSGVSSSGLLGVGEMARAHSLVRNWRDPSAHARVGQETKGISRW